MGSKGYSKTGAGVGRVEGCGVCRLELRCVMKSIPVAAKQLLGCSEEKALGRNDAHRSDNVFPLAR